jgi:hypothetical protein
MTGEELKIVLREKGYKTDLRREPIVCIFPIQLSASHTAVGKKFGRKPSGTKGSMALGKKQTEKRQRRCVILDGPLMRDQKALAMAKTLPEKPAY